MLNVVPLWLVPNERSLSELLELVQKNLFEVDMGVTLQQLRNANTSKQDGRIIVSAKTPN